MRISDWSSDVCSSDLAINQITKEKNKVFLASGPATADLTGPQSSPNTVHWTYDTWALANGTGMAIVQTGAKSWCLLTADSTFGPAQPCHTTHLVNAISGKEVHNSEQPRVRNT